MPLGRRRYLNMQYVYPRSNGIFEIRYPVPDDVQKYFPKPNGEGYRDAIVQSLGTRDQQEANRRAAEKMRDLDRRFSILRLGVIEPEFDALCRRIFEFEMRDADRRRLELVEQQMKDEVRFSEEKDRPNRIRNLNIEIFAYRDALKDRSREALEASVGWIVDHYDETCVGVGASTRHDPDRRLKLLETAASVMHDVLTRQSYAAHGITQMPPLTAAPLVAPPAEEVSVADSFPLSDKGRLSISKFWEVYIEARQATPSRLRQHTIDKRLTAWRELSEFVGPDKPLFKVRKDDVWQYHDALLKSPASAGSITELKDLSFRQRIDAMAANPGKYRSLHIDTVADRLRHINAVFQLAVDRGHLDKSVARGVKVRKTISESARDPYGPDELQLIFSSPPYTSAPPLELQTDEYWVPLLQLFMGARSSELYVRSIDAVIDHSTPHLRVVQYEERLLKNAASSRALPIHPQLIELGFIEYCKHAKENWKELFPKWEFRDDQKPSEGSGRRRFNKHLKKLMPNRGGFPADSHTFRHNFETVLSVAEGVTERAMKRLAGRAVAGSAATYIHDLPIISELEVAISKVQYRGLSLDHLKPR